MDWRLIITIVMSFLTLAGVVVNAIVSYKIKTNDLKHLQEDFQGLSQNFKEWKAQFYDLAKQVSNLEGRFNEFSKKE